VAEGAADASRGACSPPTPRRLHQNGMLGEFIVNKKTGLPLNAATDSTATLNKLALATGGTEKSWYRCIFPFGIVSVVVGVAATCITFTINGPQMDIAKVVSVATLIFGLGLLVAAYVCWRAKRERQQRRQRQEPGSAEQGAQ
uniref:TM100 protein n=1 Tax=Coturnix japonica TaxID=93934 RepID=A0A8C2U7W9_COTJA